MPGKDDIQRLRVVHNYRCGYCGVHEEDVGSQLEIDHFQPSSRGGSDEFANLVYCCTVCNRIKGDFWPADEPFTTIRRLLHPRNDDLSAHFYETPDGRLNALTDTGQFHLNRLKLNRPQLVARRRKQRLIADKQQQWEAMQMEQQQMWERLQALEQQLELLVELTSRSLTGDTDALTLLEALLANYMG